MNKYTIFRTNKFKKDYKKMMKRNNFDEKEFIKVVSMIANGEELPEKYCNHPYIRAKKRTVYTNVI